MSLFRLIPHGRPLRRHPLCQRPIRPITLSVDLTDAPRKILHATETIPVQPGLLTLVYPEWIPGEHGPPAPSSTRPASSSPPLRPARQVGARPRRHVQLPRHRPARHHSTQHQDGLPRHRRRQLHRRRQHQRQPRAAQLEHPPRLPPQRRHRAHQSLGRHGHPQHHHPRRLALRHRAPAHSAAPPKPPHHATFKTVSLEQLIDSPVLAGRWFREIDLAPEVSPKHYLDLAGDGPEDIALSTRPTSTSSPSSSAKPARSTSRATTAPTTSSSRSPTR
jgi:hypothetical protein